MMPNKSLEPTAAPLSGLARHPFRTAGSSLWLSSYPLAYMTRIAHLVSLFLLAGVLSSCKTEQSYWSSDGSQKGRFSGSGGATLCRGYHAEISVIRGEALSP